MNEQREQIEKLFERGTVADVIPSREALITHLAERKPFHIYLGLDPTAKAVHLGHVQNIMFLEELRRVGARVTLLFGSFTAQIGDPSGKSTTRPHLSRGQVRANMRLWKKQVSPVIDTGLFSGTRIDYNNRWFDRMSAESFLTIMRETTAQQLLERDMFQKRMEEGKPLHTHEMMYPLLQGYDSVAMRVDGELCATDQTFNALMGRTMVKRYLDKEKFVVVMNLVQADGMMMSKSGGTGVFVDMEHDGNHRMFGSIMAHPDGFIDILYRACTRIPMEEIRAIDMSGGIAVRDAKIRLAREIVGMFWGGKRAEEAERAYITQFRNNEVPENAPVISAKEGDTLLAVVAEHAASSRSDAKRKFTQGAVSLDGEKITDSGHALFGGEHVLRVGRRMYKVRIANS